MESRGPVAQRLEQQTHNLLVPGSNPGGPTRTSVITSVPSPQRQAKVKNRPVPQLAGEAEAAAVDFDYGFADRQAHARAVDLNALVSSAVEFFEDEGLFKIVDAGTAIGNADVEGLVGVLGFRGDADRSTGGRGFGGVLDQVHQDFPDVSGVPAGGGEGGGGFDFHRSGRARG